MSKKKLWMMHMSMQQWNDAAAWDDYLRIVESVLGDRLVKLDHNDPVRRNADTTHGEGEFITQFKPKEDSRWLYGKFEKTKVEVEIQHYKNSVDSFGRLRDNSITFYIPERMTSDPDDVRRLIELFRLTNERLGAFYSLADFLDVISTKKSSTGGALDISRELLGIFWLTYFGPHYCDFFGRERLGMLEQASAGPDGGITFQLAETPGQVLDGECLTLEKTIGAESFAGTGGPKTMGQHALTLLQLSS